MVKTIIVLFNLSLVSDMSLRLYNLADPNTKAYKGKLYLKKYMDKHPIIEVIQSWMWNKVSHEFHRGQAKFRYTDEESKEMRKVRAAQKFTGGEFVPSIGFVSYFW